VKIFVDEDTGSGIGKALEAVGVDAWYVGPGRRSRIKSGTPDEEWIPEIAADDRLIFSRNVQMLDSDSQRALLIQHGAAIVYLPAHLKKLPMLALVLRKWTWLEFIYANEPRALAYHVTPGGTHVPEPLTNYVPRRRRAIRHEGEALALPSTVAQPPKWEQLRLPPHED